MLLFVSLLFIIFISAISRSSEHERDLLSGNDDEKKKVEESDHLLLSDYDYEFVETDDGCERFIEIKDEDDYSEGDLKLIYESMYEDIEEEYFDETYMEENGWDLSGTEYEISGGVDLEEDI